MARGGWGGLGQLSDDAQSGRARLGMRQREGAGFLCAGDKQGLHIWLIRWGGSQHLCLGEQRQADGLEKSSSSCVRRDKKRSLDGGG
jgi:hypothetical protein